MNKIYKIFGAAAIVGLFMIGSALTVFAAPPQEQPQVQGGEPLGILPSDLVMIGLEKDFLDRVVVTVKNQGPGFAWSPYKIKVHVNGILNGDDMIDAWGPIIPGASTVYKTRPFVGGIIGRLCIIDIDYDSTGGFGNVWEGLKGEGRYNHYTQIL
ncbi:MAG: hypothetical protein NTV74_07425 [Euryarchaeota archaeon]|nr:hypothetical protein [Euryarchaeota archaeon]